jgi:hypothetical protein
MNLKAQGTIEYLVIVAIIIVISLIVVALVVNSAGSSALVSEKSSKLDNYSSADSFSLIESVSDINGNGLIVMENKTTDAVTLLSISSTSGTLSNSYSEMVVGLDKKTVSVSNLNDVCSCVGQSGGIIDCSLLVKYMTADGILKTDTIATKVSCLTIANPTNPAFVVGLGSGTLTDPWVINSCKELQDMNLHLDGNYVLGGDINCYTDTHLGGALYHGGAGFSPIGNCGGDACGSGAVDNNFKGNFNGNNHKIYSLYIFRPTLYGVGLYWPGFKLFCHRGY